MLRLQNFHGAELAPHIDALGALRIAVFREYPYLYVGNLENERDYLGTYVRSEGSLVVLVFEDDRVVGATTCLPMTDEGPEFKAAFEQAGYDLSKICYFGESILLPEHRGRGIGKEFFVRREAHARALGMTTSTFCAVDRDGKHPMQPEGYRPLDEFWLSQGYVKRPELQATFEWKEIGEDEESPKTLTFWVKELQ
ncbi:MAG: GNAT family N-acetyltransferase [Verrucomicrobia bacterium]|nr:GNAT family N-acetyltransferase [Verrucomicrobiota bacterium]